MSATATRRAVKRPMDEADRAREVARQREVWRRDAPHYDRIMGFWERMLFADARRWVCSRAEGDVLEVAMGTGRNLPFYPADARLTGIDLSPEMLAIARKHAQGIRRAVTLQEGDAHHLDFSDDAFDTVVCAFSMCNIPDQRQALTEMHRVLRPEGTLILVDHVASTSRVTLRIQRLLEKLTIRSGGEHLTRRPLPLVLDVGFTIESHQRDKLGIVERLTARP